MPQIPCQRVKLPVSTPVMRMGGGGNSSTHLKFMVTPCIKDIK